MYIILQLLNQKENTVEKTAVETAITLLHIAGIKGRLTGRGPSPPAEMSESCCFCGLLNHHLEQFCQTP